MPSYGDSIAAATFVAGYNAFAGKIGVETDGRPRKLTGFGMVGSSAIANTECEIYVDTEKIGSFLNQAATGTALTNDYIEDIDKLVHPNQKVAMNVTVGATTNAIAYRLEWDILSPEEYAEELSALGA